MASCTDSQISSGNCCIPYDSVSSQCQTDGVMKRKNVVYDNLQTELKTYFTTVSDNVSNIIGQYDNDNPYVTVNTAAISPAITAYGDESFTVYSSAESIADMSADVTDRRSELDNSIAEFLSTGFRASDSQMLVTSTMMTMLLWTVLAMSLLYYVFTEL